MNLNDLFLARYEVGGRGPDSYDCFGLFREVCARRGVAVPDLLTPDEPLERQALMCDRIKAGWVKLDTPEPWCGVALRIGHFVSHVGIVLEDGIHFLHINEDTGVVRARLDNPMWAQRIAGFYRWGGA